MTDKQDGYCGKVPRRWSLALILLLYTVWIV